MLKYRYKGKSLAGKIVNGSIQARSESECYMKLKDQGIFAYSLTEVKGKMHGNYRLKAMELSEFSRQIGTMQKSGIPLLRAIEIIRDSVKKPKLIAIYRELYTYISSGNSLSEGMKNSNGAFPEIMINMYKSGEANGKLDQAAIKMATYYENEHKIALKIKNAMAYPSILAVITLLITIGIFTYVMPQFFDIILAAGNELNFMTKMIFAFSQFLITRWYVVILIAGTLLVIGVLLVRTYKLQIDKIKLAVPKVDRLLSIIYTSRFARTLSSLYSSGVSMIEAVEISSKTIGNLHIQKEMITVVQKVRNGAPLSVAIEGIDGLDKKLVSAIYVGEETGELDTMLTAVSEEYEFESGMAIERMLTFVEPIMLVVMGLIIGIVVVSVFMPLMQMYSAI